VQTSVAAQLSCLCCPYSWSCFTGKTQALDLYFYDTKAPASARELQHIHCLIKW